MVAIRSALYITIGETTLAAEKRRGSHLVWGAIVPASPGQDMEQSLSSLAAQRGCQVRRAEVVLAPSMVQHRVLRDLPPVKSNALQDLVSHQQTRFFRHGKDHLVTSAAWIGPDRTAGARAVAVEPSLLDAIELGLAAAGVRRVRIMAPCGALLLQGPVALATHKLRGRRQCWTLLVVAMLSWFSAAAVHVGRLAHALHAVDLELAALDAPAQALRKARGDLSTAALIVAQVDSGGAVRHDVADLLGAVVGALPDSSVLSGISRSGTGRLKVTGYALNPSAYLARLQQLPRIGSLASDKALAREADSSGWEAFMFQFEPRLP